MNATTINTSHTRDEHFAQGDTNTWSQADRIASRSSCSFCRLIFRDNGEFRVADRSDWEFGGQAPARPAARPAARTTARTVYPATEAQTRFAKSLWAERDHGQWTDALRDEALQDKARTSKMIDWLLAQPKKAAAAPAPAVTVPDGRYALRTEEHIAFYVVNTPTKGQWAGRTFVSVQASDDLHPLRNRAQREGILARIAEDPKGASALYGQELGRCGVCGRTLTDDESRARGIGPVCYEKF